MVTPEVPDLELVAVRALARAARLLEHACCTAMSLPQYRMLAMVAAGGQRASHLAGNLDLARPSVTAVVDGLVKKGWLVRSAVAGDRRAACIQLTPAGREALSAEEDHMAERLMAVVARAPEPAGVLAGLAGLGQALDAVAVDRAAPAAQVPVR